MVVFLFIIVCLFVLCAYVVLNISFYIFMFTFAYIHGNIVCWRLHLLYF